MLLAILAFVTKETRLILHQPRLIFSLILGPFLILLVFGVGYQDQPRVLKTLFVVPDNSDMRATVEEFVETLDSRFEFAGITADAAEADRRLRVQVVDLVVVTPPNPMSNWEQGEQSVFTLYHYEIDPLEATYIRVLGQLYADEINRRTLLTTLGRSQQEVNEWQIDASAAKNQAATMRQALEAGNQEQAEQAAAELKHEVDLLMLAAGSGLAAYAATTETVNGDSTETVIERLQNVQAETEALMESGHSAEALAEEGPQKAAAIEVTLNEVEGLLAAYQEIEPAVIVAPFRSEALNVTNVNIEPMHFYVPGVIALLLQHLAVTLAGLSIIREKLSGAMELFRASPVTAFEMLTGKYLGFLLLIGVLAVVLTALTVGILRVPQLGFWAVYALVIVILLLASLGVGFNISLSARSNSQAIQFAMLILLSSIFFSGFFLPLYRLQPFAQVISWLMPATYATVLLQDIMLRGQGAQLLLLLALFLFAAVLFLIAWFRLAWQLRKQ
jgi:ABC-2 type transport system permease protein